MDEKRDYLIDELSKEERLYLEKIVINVRNKYIRNNYDYINNPCLDIYNIENIESESVLEEVIENCEKEIKYANEFEKIVSNSNLYDVIKALSLKEKTVLFSLYKENKEISQIANDMKIARETVWRIKNRALDKIAKSIVGGNENV